ncbi:MAG: hypothetical protein ACYCVY_08785 [Acidiferrobacteraceae bacterium]
MTLILVMPVVVDMGVEMVMAMSHVAMLVMAGHVAAHFFPGGPSDPSTKSHQRKARQGIHVIPYSTSKDCPDTPEDKTYEQGADYMPGTGNQRRAYRLYAAPVLLTGNHCDRKPMIGHYGMENTHQKNR